MSERPESDSENTRRFIEQLDAEFEAEDERNAIHALEAAQEQEQSLPLEAYADEPRARTNGHTAAAQLESRKLGGIDFAQMQPHLADGYLVKGLLAPRTLAAIIGASGSGKTFFATDIACHIAAGRSWRGRRVRAGLVVYVALEGPVSAENRFVAARDRLHLPQTTPLRLTPGPLNLRNPLDVQLLIDFIRESEALHGSKAVAVFVDTLSRALAGGDENGSEDMGALIAGADAVLLATGVAVILVHHLGKDENRGARGHSSLKAALDTEIEVSERAKAHIAVVTKQRDLMRGEQFGFALRQVELGRDDDGDAVTTCVLEPLDDVPQAKRGPPAGKNQVALLAALQEWQRQHPDTEILSSIDVRAIAKAQGIKKKSALDVALAGLGRSGWITPCAGGVRFRSEDSL